jgi:transketolase
MNLQEIAKELRQDIIESIYHAGSGHPGGSLSCIDILTVLYFYKMKLKPNEPEWENRDRFIMSKGHAVPAQYAVLARAGFFPKEELKTLRQPGSRLQGHPYITLPGIEATTGSLGQGLAVGNGMALAGKLDKKDYHVYVLLGDGELQEGDVWESVMSSANFKLDNITAIVDNNGLQQSETVDNTKSLGDLKGKFESFGWYVIEINGHDLEQIKSALDEETDKPKMIIAKTVKGKGVSFMENKLEWHGVAPNKEEYEKAMEELK